MAKKALSGTKSPKIRNYKAANPSASPMAIADALAKTGIAVTAQFVSIVLRKAKKKGSAECLVECVLTRFHLLAASILR
jgi:hypothetical protein